MDNRLDTRASLLVRLRDQRDERAWAGFVELYAPLVYGFARRKGLQDADAADLTQDVLRKVAGAMADFQYDPARGTFRSWLFTVTRNALRNWHGRRDRNAVGTGDTAAQALLANQPDDDPGLETGWQLEYERRVFQWAAAQVQCEVEPATWQAFWRTAVDGQPAAVVARELNITVANIYRSKNRVMVRLKEHITSIQ